MSTEPCVPLHFQLLALWQRHVGRELDNVTQSFFAVGGHPAQVEPMLEEAAQETGVRVPTDQFLARPTVAALAQAMLSAGASDEIREIQPGHGPPFFYFHGDILGGGFYARPLPGWIGSEYPFYLVPPAVVTPDTEATIESIAAQRCAALQELHPHGPYIIGGFCIEALVAYEVARQLAAAGEVVQSLVLVDPELSTATERLVRRVIERTAMGGKVARFAAVNRKLDRLHDVWKSPLREKAQFIVRNGRKFLHRGGDQPPGLISDDTDTGEVIIDPWRLEVFQWLAAGYEVKPYHGPVTILLSDEQRDLRPSQMRDWRRVLPQMRLRRIAGRHMTAITTHRALLAAQIREAIQSDTVPTVPHALPVVA